MRRLCHLPPRPPPQTPQSQPTMNAKACNLTRLWLEVQAMKMVEVRYEGPEGNFLVISFPKSQQPLDRLAGSVWPNHTGLIPTAAADLVSVWHGASLWAAWHIFHHHFLIGNYGHNKSSSGRRVNGIWGMLDYDHCILRAATSKCSQELCSQCPNGLFDAWSTPVGIEFKTHSDELTTCRGTEAGVRCIENMDGRILNLAGLRAIVQHRIHRIKFSVRTYCLYRTNLADQHMRDQITTGELIMCSGRWCYPGMTGAELADALVCPNHNNPCSKLIHARANYYSSGWHKTNKKQFFLPRMLAEACACGLEQAPSLIRLRFLLSSSLQWSFWWNQPHV